jgi:hypothetical protein
MQLTLVLKSQQYPGSPSKPDLVTHVGVLRLAPDDGNDNTDKFKYRLEEAATTESMAVVRAIWRMGG